MRNFLLSLFAGLMFSSAFGQSRSFWSMTDESQAGVDLFQASKSKRPSAFKLFRLDETAFKQFMANAPHERNVPVSASPFIVDFPMPDGSVQKFRVVNAPSMEEGLAAKFPGINSYAGIGVNDPSANIRFDVSMHGVHATILKGSNSAVYIDQMYQNYYRVARRSDMTDAPLNFECFTENFQNQMTNREGIENNADDGKLRTYRLAMISGAEFSLHFIPAGGLPSLADSVAAVIAAQNSHVTRTNQVYERDFGVRLVLVSNNNQVVYFNPATDPIANPSNPVGATCMAAIDAQIGNGNYDIGHTESKGSDNGNAGCIGCVCNNTTKGRGWTVYSNPSLLEFFVIDYLTHEIGHQFGANHTFSFNLEGTGVNVEPGSGVTIMGYAGITGSTDVAPHSIELFSVKSIEQVTNYIKTGTGATCAVQTTTGNTAPTVNAGTDYIIPISTPFKLTGTATDPDPTDVLTYNWEQVDVRTGAFPSIPSATATNGPMFRTYLSYSIPERTFPSLQYILTGANGFQWEVLPSVARTMNFRFLAKDNRIGGGNNESDDMAVTVSNLGPFLITTQNTAVTWTAGTTETVSWSVNGTTGAPINCANVKISVSTDGGTTFTTLVASTPNDGSEVITVPNTPSTTGRVKVEAVGNIFFDINNANFTIIPPPFGFIFGSTAAATAACPAPASMTVTLPVNSAGGYNNPVTLSTTSTLPAGTTVSFGTNPVTPTGSSVVTLNGTNTLAAGTYTVTVQGAGAGATNQTATLTFTINAGSGPAITGQPANLAVCIGQSGSFSVTSSGTYQWQVSTNGGTSWSNISGASTATYAVTGATAINNNQYRCIVTGQCGSTTSSAATLTVNPTTAITTQPVSLALCSGSAASFTTAAYGAGLTYQWQLSTDGGTSWNPIGGASASTYNIAAVATSQNNNQFRCVVTGTCGSATTSAATLTVSSNITISTQPVSQTVCEATNISFTSGAAGSGLSYQWQISTNGGGSWTNLSNGGVYSGTTSTTLTITGVLGTQNGNQFRMVASNTSCSPGTSNAATLTVNTFPTITTQPQSVQICEGGNATFSVAASTGVGTLTYQWQFSTNGINYTSIPGATASSYTITGTVVGQNNYVFRVLVSAGCGTVNSALALLNVNPFPVISFNPTSTVCKSDQPVALTATPGGGTFSGTGVTGGSFNPTVAGVGPKAVTYSVTASGCTSNATRTILVNQCAERQLTIDKFPAIIVYPSPNNGQFNIGISTDIVTKLEVRVFNAIGQQIQTKSFSGVRYGAVLPMDISGQPSGTYQVYMVNDENGKVTTKAVSIVVYR